MVREGDKVWVKVRDVDVPWITASWWTWFQRREAVRRRRVSPIVFLVWGGKKEGWGGGKAPCLFVFC